jgi:transposase InsO family protein
VEGNQWRREELFPGQWKVPAVVTRRSALHFVSVVSNVAPVQGEIRPIAVKLRSMIGALTCDWDQVLSEEHSEILELLRLLELIANTRNPMRGTWWIGNSHNWTLYTDASSHMLGAVLLNEDQVVADFSMSVKKRSWHVNLNELEAVCKGFSKLALHYVRPGATIQLLVDNTSVVSWINAALNDVPIDSVSDDWPLIERRLARICQYVELFGLKVTVKYVASSDNKADKLTRIASTRVTAAVADGAANQVCPVPVAMRWYRSNGGGAVNDDLINKVHVELGHASINQTNSVLERWFADGGQVDAKAQVMALGRQCAVCFKKSARLTKVFPDYVQSKATAFSDTLQIDAVVIDQQYFYSIIDSASRFAQVYPVERPTGSATRECLQSWVSGQGVVPRIVRCDNGAEFAGALDSWAAENLVNVRRGAVSNPRAQALVERFHRSLITIVKCMEERPLLLKEKVFAALMIYNLRPHAAFNYRASPLEMKEKLRSRGWSDLDFGEAVDDDEMFTVESQVAAEVIDHDGGDRAEGRLFAVGDAILWKDPNSRKKSAFPWKSGEVVEAYGRGGYLVRFDSGCKPERVVNERLMAPGMPKNESVSAADAETPSSAEEAYVTADDDAVSDERPVSEPRRSQRTHRAPNRYGFED